VAGSPEELETMLEDAFVVHDHDAVRWLFEPSAVLRTAREEARGREQIDVLIHRLWGRQVTYLADPAAILHQRGIALIVSDLAVNVARRGSDGSWRYALVFLGPGYQPRARHSGRDGRSVPRVVSAPWPG
jgi:hypothetical protein